MNPIVRTWKWYWGDSLSSRFVTSILLYLFGIAGIYLHRKLWFIVTCFTMASLELGILIGRRAEKYESQK